MTKIKTLLETISNHDRVYQSSGNEYADIYGEHINKETGEWEIFVKGQSFLPDLINTGVEESLPVNLMKRYELGEKGVLDQIVASYVDLTEFPQDFMEAQNRILEVQDRFNSLDVELRDMFGNNVNLFMKGFEDGSTLNRVEEYNQMLRDRRDNLVNSHIVEPISVKEGNVNE